VNCLCLPVNADATDVADVDVAVVTADAASPRGSSCS